MDCGCIGPPRCGGGNRAAAQTDVTNTYLTNADFESATTVTNGVCTYNKDCKKNNTTFSGLQTVSGWTANKPGLSEDKANGNTNYSDPSDMRAGGAYSYGSTSFIGGSGYTAPSTDKNGKTGSTLGIVNVWGGSNGTEGYYYQEATLPAGNYTLTVDVYNSKKANTSKNNGGKEIKTNRIGFVSDDNTVTHYGTTTTFSLGTWTTETVTFTLSQETMGKICLGYVSNDKGSDATPHLFFDNLKLTYTVIKDELKAAIDRATATNKVINNSELTTAITTAQGVYDDASVLQAAVDEATTTLVNAIDTAVKAALDAGLTDGDVTAIFLANYNFETAPITFTDGAKNSEAVRIGSNDKKDGWVYTIPGWTNASVVNNNAVQIATATYGGTYSGNNQGLNSTNPPSADNEGNAGAGLHMSAGYGDDAILTQQSLYTLPAGTYELTYNVYNANSKTGIAENFTGVSIDGTATYGSKLLATQDKWESDAVTFTLKEAKVVTFSLGFTTSTSGSGNGAKLYVDNLKLTYSSSTVDKTALQTAIDNATTANATLNNSDLTTAIATAQAVYDNASATQDDVDQAVTTLNAAVTTAKNNIANGTDVTALFVTNPSFETGSLDPWTKNNDYKDSGVKSVTQDNNKFATDGTDGNYLFNTWDDKATEKLVTQTVEDLPEGYYQVTALVASDNGKAINLVAGDTKTAVTATTAFQRGATGKVHVEENGSLVIGATSTNWYKADDFHLIYYVTKEVYSDTLAAAQAVDKTQPMNGTVKTALETALNNYGSATSDYPTAITALQTAATNATASIAAYAHAKTALDNRDKLTKTTNFYTANALNTFYTSPLAAYNEGTMEDATATALEDPYAETKIAWHKSTQVNAFMGSAWGFSDYTKSLYVNTWSTEGDTDGSDFKVPFYEYWTDDANKLGAATWTGSVTGLDPDTYYNVSALVRVRLSNDQEAPAAGISMQVADGAAVSIAGTQIGESRLYLGNYSATGKADADGNLNVKFIVADGTNVSWLAFQNVKYEAASAQEAYESALATAKAALANTTNYGNVTGNEKTALETAIKSYGNNTSDFETATTALTTATTAFTAAKDSYDAFVTAQGLATADLNLPYATAEKKTAFATARNAEPTTATDAKTDAATLTTALRAYYESNAKAEGKTGAEAVTITNPSGGSESSNLDGWTTAVMRINHDEPYTTSDNTAHDYYFDANDDFWRSNATTSASMRQDVTLPSSGTYLLSVMSRSCETISSFKLFAGDNSTEMGHNGSSGQVFGNGWNSHYLVFTAPAGAISIGVEGTTPANTQGNWFSCDNFQLYRIGDLATVTLNETSTEGPTTSNDYVDMTYGRTLYTGWNSLVLPFDLDVSTLGSNTGSSESDGSESNSSTMQVITYDGTDSNDDGSVTFKFSTCTTTLAAGTPCMVYNNGGSDLTQSLTGTCRFTHNTDMSPKTTDDNASGYDFTGTYKAYDKNATDNPITLGDYYVNAKGLKAAKGGNKLNAFRAFFKHKGTDSTQAAKVNFVIDGNDVTGIKAVELEHAVLGDGAAYNLAGQKVNGSYKGLVIKNGKKIINK